MLFIKIESYGVVTDVCNQIDNSYVGYFQGEFGIGI